MTRPRACGGRSERRCRARRRPRPSAHRRALPARHRRQRRSGCRRPEPARLRPRSLRTPASTPMPSTACCGLLASHGIFARARGRAIRAFAGFAAAAQRPPALAALIRADERHACLLGSILGACRNRSHGAAEAGLGQPRRLFRRAPRRIGDLQRGDGQQVAHRAAGRRGRLRFQRLRHDRRHRRRPRPSTAASPRCRSAGQGHPVRARPCHRRRARRRRASRSWPATSSPVRCPRPTPIS